MALLTVLILTVLMLCAFGIFRETAPRLLARRARAAAAVRTDLKDDPR